MVAGPENLETRQVEAAREVRRVGQFRETLGPKFRLMRRSDKWRQVLA